VVTSHRQAIFYVSPSEQSLDNQQQQQLQFDESSPTSANERRQRCASASCASSQHVHSPVLAAPTTSTDDILSRTQSLSTKQRTRESGTRSNTTGSLHHRSHLAHQNEYEEDDFDDNVLIDSKAFVDPWALQIPPELYSSTETKGSIIDELVWNDPDFISIPHFDLNDIVNDSKNHQQSLPFSRCQAFLRRSS
jgi:hypothetical protein